MKWSSVRSALPNWVPSRVERRDRSVRDSARILARLA